LVAGLEVYATAHNADVTPLRRRYDLVVGLRGDGPADNPLEWVDLNSDYPLHQGQAQDRRVYP
jgi:hypothetical protein